MRIKIKEIKVYLKFYFRIIFDATHSFINNKYLQKIIACDSLFFHVQQTCSPYPDRRFSNFIDILGDALRCLAVNYH